MKPLKSYIARGFDRAAVKLGLGEVRRELAQLREEIRASSKQEQLLLFLAYTRCRASGGPWLSLNDIEFRTFSQNGEDGILLYLFSILGTTNKVVIEICAGDGTQCNAANLIINHGWTGLLVDGDAGNVARGGRFYAEHADTFTYPPRFANAWVEVDNVNQLIAANGFEGEIDLLSLDIDGIDYWLWEAITVVQPRVVVAEIQAIWGDTESVTVPYRPDFRAEYIDGFGVYSGASLSAFVKLARRKGYRLIGTQRYGFNAFFLRDDIGQDVFPEVTPGDCLRHPFVTWAQKTLLPRVQDRAWIRV